MSDEFEVVEEIEIGRLSRYIESSRDCRIGNVCEMGKLGHIILNLSGIDPDECRLTMRRKSGNGMLMMSTGHASNVFRISSKVGQDVRMFMRGGKLELRRPARSQGEIEVTSIVLSKKVKKAVEWSKILDRATERSCIKLVGNKLMAASGARIVADEIGEVETSPPNMYRKNDDDTEVVFAGACEVITLDINGPGRSAEAVPPQMKEGTKPLQKESPSGDAIEQQALTPTKNATAKGEPAPVIPEAKYLLFDSDTAGFNRAFIVGSGAYIPKQGISLNPRAEYRFSLERVAPETPYVIIVEARTLSGNGKLSAGIAPGGKPEVQLVPRHKKTMRFRCGAGQRPHDSFQFFITRTPASTGEVLIHRIMIMGAVPRESMKDVLDRHAIADPDLSQSCSVHVDEEKDPILRLSKQYARHLKQRYDDLTPMSLQRILSTNTFCSSSWFSKVSPILTSVRRSSNAKSADIAMGVPGCLSKAKRIFIEESVRELSSEDFDLLNGAEKIFTNSQQLVNKIAETIPEHKVEFTPRYWPLPGPQGIPFLRGEFVLVFNRHSEITKRILSCLPDGCPRVVLVGARGRYEQNVIPINEYLPYRKLVWLMGNAKAIVDVQMVSEYHSGALDACKFLNRPIVTNNWTLMGDPDVDLVISDEKYESIHLPEPESISAGIESALDRNLKPTRDYTPYNKKVMDSLVHIFK